jgi:hypothetical protein
VRPLRSAGGTWDSPSPLVAGIATASMPSGGALRRRAYQHVRAAPCPSSITSPDYSHALDASAAEWRHARVNPFGGPFAGIRGLWWLTLTAFEDGITADPEAWAAICEQSTNAVPVPVPVPGRAARLTGRRAQDRGDRDQTDLAGRPEDGVRLQTFHDNWRHPHGTLATNVHVMRRYVQDHRLGPDNLVGVNQTPLEGVLEAWFDNTAAIEASGNDPYIRE